MCDGFSQHFLLRFSFFLFLVKTSIAFADVVPIQSDIVFVTQVPVSTSANNIVSTSGNHRSSIVAAPRGGDLYLRYRTGELRNLTAEAGYGTPGLQAANSIAVRDPVVNWNGNKVLFSMVIGSPAEGETKTFYWQLYEVVGLAKSETPVISKVQNQPTNYNNVMPAYGSDDQILFVSDRPKDGQSHLYPQLDEALSFQTNSGLWKLDRTSGKLSLLDSAPSGVFSPFVDSFGRVIMTRWDHLERDLLGEDGQSNGAFNFSNERADSFRLNSKREVFPEPRNTEVRSANLNLHSFNQFFPWQINQDGSDLETLNHVGRHELRESFRRNFTNDSNLKDFEVESSSVNKNRIANLFQIKEDSQTPGLYLGIDAPQFDSHGAGQLVSLFAPPALSADQITVKYLTHRDTHSITQNPTQFHSGLYRDPVSLSNGELVSSHTSYTGVDSNDQTRESPSSRYKFELKRVSKDQEFWTAKESLNSKIVKSISYFDPTVLVTYSGELWQLQPVELIAKNRPGLTTEKLFTPELTAFAESAVNVDQFKAYLEQNNLALIVGRNVTTRDKADRQQPFNLRVANTKTQSLGSSGKIYDVSHLKIFQGDLIRAYGGIKFPLAGRRVLAQPMHEELAVNPPSSGGPPGSVKIAEDGSIAAIVPATRALSWELTNPNRQSVVKERYWLTLKPGEIRVCTACHGANTQDQTGKSPSQITPEALKYLLNYWKTHTTSIPKFKLDIVSSKTPAISKRKFYGNDNVIIKILGKNDYTVSKSVDVTLRAGDLKCDFPIQHLITASDGNGSFRGLLPKLESKNLPRLIPITLELVYSQKVTARVTFQLHSSNGGGVSRKINRNQLNSICRSFENFQ